MKSLRHLFILTALWLLCGLSASAQTPANDAKQFDKDGLTFEYSAGWTFNDTSNADAQQMTFARPDSEAQIRLFVFRPPVNTPERVAEARKVLVDPYIAATAKQFQQMGAKSESSPATTEIAGLPADGVRLSASLEGEPGAAEIYSAVVGQRLVVLTRFGPDKALTRALPTWDLIRTTIKIEAPQPKSAQPSATPKPKGS